MDCALNHVRFRAAMNPTWFRAECGVKKNTIRKETGDGEMKVKVSGHQEIRKTKDQVMRDNKTGYQGIRR
jgi:hypothetical protein